MKMVSEKLSAVILRILSFATQGMPSKILVLVIRTDLFPLAGLKEEHDSGYDAVAMSQINSSGSRPRSLFMALFQLPIKSS